MRATRKFVAVAGAAVLGLSTMVAGAATAVAARAEVVTEPYEYQSFECGYPIDVAGEFTFAAENRTRSPKDPDLFFYRERFSFREVWTNPDTGASIVFSGAWL